MQLEWEKRKECRERKKQRIDRGVGFLGGFLAVLGETRE